MFAVVVSVFVALVVLIALARGADELFSTAVGVPLFIIHWAMIAGVVYRLVAS